MCHLSLSVGPKRTYCQVQIMENPVFLLRKALGLTQQQMAERLECGYSTLQQYERGAKLGAETRAKAIDLAHANHLENLAQLLSEQETEGSQKRTRYNPENRRWHDMLETILESGDARANEAVKPNLVLFFEWVQKMRPK